MNNYEYIIASLPVIAPDTRDASLDADSIIEEVMGQLSERDLKTAGILMSSYEDGALTKEFYENAFRSGCGFIRKYFKADLDERNAKVEYLNRALGRPEGTDAIIIGEPDEDDLNVLEGILSSEDILKRERSLDEYMWDKVDAFTELHVFDLDLILGFIVKLKIIDRWMKLDEETGRELFRKFVEEIRKSKNI